MVVYKSAHKVFCKFLVIILCGLTASAYCEVAAQERTESYQVGVAVIEARDTSRNYAPEAKPWGMDVEINGARPIQTVVWYPALDDGSGFPVLFEDYAYLSGSDETFMAPNYEVRSQIRKYVADYVGVSQRIVAEHLDAEMSARWDANATGSQFPLVVYAPGWGQPSWMNYRICEVLASHGYVVVASPSFSNESRDMVEGFIGLDAQVRDITFLAKTVSERPDVNAEQIAIVGYSWGGLANIIATQRLENVDAVVSIDGAISVLYTIISNETNELDAETMDIPFMSLSPPQYRTTKELVARGLDTTFVFYDGLKLADAYDIVFPRMRDHEDVVSVYTRFLDHKTDRNTADREAAVTSYGLMTQYVVHFLEAYVRGDQESIEWLRQSPRQNGLPNGFVRELWKQGRGER